MDRAGKIRVLHIDDDRYFLDLFRSTHCDDFDILSRPSGDDILELLYREHIDALVVDYNLPCHDGLDILKNVRARFPSMPVVFYTGRAARRRPARPSRQVPRTTSSRKPPTSCRRKRW